MVGKDDIGLNATVGDDLGCSGGVDKLHGMGGRDSPAVWAKVREAGWPVCVRNAKPGFGRY